MITNKKDLNPINEGMRDEKRKELLEALQPINVKAYLQKLAKEQPNLSINTGNDTANALARNCIKCGNINRKTTERI